MHQIESVIYLNDDYVDEIRLEDVMCFVQTQNNDEILKLKAKFIYKLTLNYVFKVVCAFESFIDKHENIGVAIVLLNDFKNNNDFSYFGTNSFPFEMINYQSSDIVTEVTPRLSKVGVCLQYISKVNDAIPSWIELHKQSRVDKIVMYDGSPTRGLRKILKNLLNLSFVEIRKYNLKLNEICESKQINYFKYSNPDAYPYYYRSCKRFFKSKYC